MFYNISVCGATVKSVGDGRSGVSRAAPATWLKAARRAPTYPTELPQPRSFFKTAQKLRPLEAAQ